MYKFEDDIIEPFAYIMNNIGYEALSVFLDEFGGSSIYVPTKKRLFTTCIIKQIVTEFDGSNYKQLAKKFGFCERSVRNFVLASIKKK